VTLLHLIILAIVQGLTEFLPVSSSAHLVLTPQLAGFDDQGPLIDVMAHVGTLGAVLVYFRKDVAGVVTGGLQLLRGRMTAGGRLALLVAAATPPALATGAILYAAGLADALRDPRIIIAANLVFALPLWLADRWGASRMEVETMRVRDAVLIGLAQCFAFLPGASRSGVTMTAARALGMTRREAGRFSMLMAIPIIAALGLVATLDLARGAGGGVDLADGLIAAGLSFVAALAAIAAFMSLVERIGFLPFVLYRIALAALVWWLLLA